jgi:hypothetical protein
VLVKKGTGESSEEFSFFDFRIVVVPESVGTWKSALQSEWKKEFSKLCTWMSCFDYAQL